MLNRFIITLFLASCFLVSDAQIKDKTLYKELESTSVDSVGVDTAAVAVLDSTKIKKKKKFFLKGILKEPYPSPRKAALLSVILPGAGQAYNKKYWKIPLVYAGIGGLAYAIHWNGREYRVFRDAYKARVDGDPNTTDIYEGFLDANSLRNIRDGHFKNYQLSFIGFGFVYLLNGIEAYVDAHLLDFDVDDDLSLHLYPNTQIGPDGSPTFSLSFSLHEKNKTVEIHPGFIGLK